MHQMTRLVSISFLLAACSGDTTVAPSRNILGGPPSVQSLGIADEGSGECVFDYIGCAMLTLTRSTDEASINDFYVYGHTRFRMPDQVGDVRLTGLIQRFEGDKSQSEPGSPPFWCANAYGQKINACADHKTVTASCSRVRNRIDVYAIHALRTLHGMEYQTENQRVGGCEPARADVCDNPEAPNYGQEGECLPPVLCLIEGSSNFGGTGDCPPPPPPPPGGGGSAGSGQDPVCEDPAATNYQAGWPCRYPPPDVCTTPGASNYGEEGECDMPPSCWWEYIYYEGNWGYHTVCEAPTTEVRLAASPSRHAYPPQHLVVLRDDWRAHNSIALVSRTRYRDAWHDIIYLPAHGPDNARAWALATRFLSIMRQGTTGSPDNRVIRVERNGTARGAIAGHRGVSLPKLAPLSPAAQGRITTAFYIHVESRRAKAPKHASIALGGLTTIPVR
jgi:hypothetical protein